MLQNPSSYFILRPIHSNVSQSLSWKHDWWHSKHVAEVDLNSVFSLYSLQGNLLPKFCFATV